jgi:hypothetical protein
MFVSTWTGQPKEQIKLGSGGTDIQSFDPPLNPQVGFRQRNP